MRVVLLTTVVMSLVLSAGVARAQDTQTDTTSIVGVWLTAEGKAKVEISRTGDAFAGKIIWLKEPDEDGKPKVDKKNPDEKLRQRPVIGLEIVYGFTYDGDNVWSGGKVYDPESGNEYKAKMTLLDDKALKLRGYILVPLLGRSEIWTR